MNESWLAYLSGMGAVLDAGRVAHFGDPAGELHAAKSATIVCDLSHMGLIQFTGDEAQSFLQGQLSCDVGALDPNASSYGSYSTPKGRMLATFLLWRAAAGFFMQLPIELRESVQKRLSMFILRAKVKAADVSAQYVRIGVAGADAARLSMSAAGSVPDRLHGVTHGVDASVIRLPGERFEIVTSPERAIVLWDSLRAQATPAGAPCWDWLDIACGIATITPRTQDQFVPQMANLDLIGGVSFDKGCYPGQEIVARTQYRGQIKRRMVRANVVSSAAPLPGDELFRADFPGQSSGMIVNSAPSPDGGYDVLAVVQIAGAAANAMHLKAPDGPALTLLELPYALPGQQA